MDMSLNEFQTALKTYETLGKQTVVISNNKCKTGTFRCFFEDFMSIFSKSRKEYNTQVVDRSLLNLINEGEDFLNNDQVQSIIKNLKSSNFNNLLSNGVFEENSYTLDKVSLQSKIDNISKNLKKPLIFGLTTPEIKPLDKSRISLNTSDSTLPKLTSLYIEKKHTTTTEDKEDEVWHDAEFGPETLLTETEALSPKKGTELIKKEPVEKSVLERLLGSIVVDKKVEDFLNTLLLDTYSIRESEDGETVNFKFKNENIENPIINATLEFEKQNIDNEGTAATEKKSFNAQIKKEFKCTRKFKNGSIIITPTNPGDISAVISRFAPLINLKALVIRENSITLVGPWGKEKILTLNHMNELKLTIK